MNEKQQRIDAITQWLQREDEELRYEPQEENPPTMRRVWYSGRMDPHDFGSDGWEEPIDATEGEPEARMVYPSTFEEVIFPAESSPLPALLDLAAQVLRACGELAQYQLRCHPEHLPIIERYLENYVAPLSLHTDPSPLLRDLHPLLPDPTLPRHLLRAERRP